MRLDLTVNLLTMQALTKGAMTVLGGSQIRPNIHIDDLVEVYLFALDRRLAGVYNAGFENLSILDIARCIASHVPAEVQILPSNDPRSYRQCSDRLVAAGFAPIQNRLDRRSTNSPACTLPGGCATSPRRTTSAG